MATGKYNYVQHIAGYYGKAYATTNHAEYFAEVTEAFFSSNRFRNDWYPFTNSELKQFDPDGYNLCVQVYRTYGASSQLL